MSGIDILRAIQRDGTTTRRDADGRELSAFVYDALKLGAAGFLTKAATIDEICDAVASARGATVLAPEVQSASLASCAHASYLHGAVRPRESNT